MTITLSTDLPAYPTSVSYTHLDVYKRQRVEYASGTKQNLDAMVKAGLNGMTMPRRFGGLNFPITPYTCLLYTSLRYKIYPFQ